MSAMLAISPAHFLAVGIAVFSAGAVGVLLRRDAVAVFMCIELMLNGVNISLLTFARMFNDYSAQVFVMVILAVAAAEAAIGLAIMIIYNRTKKNVLLEGMNTLKG